MQASTLSDHEKESIIRLLTSIEGGLSIRHYGILGQKWGVRRFQNADGTYTEAGKKRLLIERQKQSIFQRASKFQVKTKTGEVLNIEPRGKPNSTLGKKVLKVLLGVDERDSMGYRGDANYIISRQGKAIGQLSLINKNSKVAYGDWITIDESFRGRGYARDILEDVINKARDAGYEKFEINALSKPGPLYERIGFTYSKNLGLIDRIGGFEFGCKRMEYDLTGIKHMHYYTSDELYHYGILGQKWGVRRFQNKDGTYTSEGKRRRNVEPHEDYAKAHSKKPISQMSDKELRERNNRLQAEKQYRDLTSSKRYEKGKKIVKEVLWVGGTITAMSAMYKKNKDAVDGLIDKIGDWVISDLRF